MKTQPQSNTQSKLAVPEGQPHAQDTPDCHACQRELASLRTQLDETQRELAAAKASAAHFRAAYDSRPRDAAASVAEHFYELFDDLDLYVFAKDARFRYTHVNKRLCEWMGRPLEAVIGQSDESFVTQETLRGVRENDAAVLERGETVVPEEPEVSQEEDETPPRSYHAVKFPLRDADKKIVGLLGFAVDITPQARAAEAVRASERRLSTALDHMLEGCQIIGRDYRMTYVNDAAERQARRPKAELLGRTLMEAWPGYEQTQIFAVIEDCLNTGQTHVIEMDFLFPDNTAGFFEVRIEPIPAGVLILSIDRTAHRRAEQEREQLRKRLAHAHALEAIGQLSGGIAHDFNNMLAVILTHADLVLQSLGPEHPAREDVEFILQAAERSSNLTNQLLAFARRQTVAPQVVDINRCITDLLEMLERLITENVTVSFDPGPELWSLHIDPTQLDQMLVNLCVNARDAIPDTGHVTISTRNLQLTDDDELAELTRDWVRITVEDDGIGMDTKTRERMFEPFFSTKGPGGGTGLGLATVYGVVKQNNGLIHVWSEPGRGTRIAIDLPRYGGEVDIRPAVVRKASIRSPGAETILIVEDEPAILHSTERIIRSLNYQVLTATSAAEALRIAAEHDGPIDLVLTDVIMPEMNGRDLSHRLCALRPGLRVLFTSGYTGDLIGRHGVLEPGTDLLPKPYSGESLAERLREVLDRGVTPS